MTSISLTGNRTLGPEDYDSIINIWKLAGLPYKPDGRDSREEITRQMKMDPDMFLGYFIDGKMVGTIMGSYDSRKGWVNRLAVLPQHRGEGVGRSLVREMEARLKKRGFRIIATLIEDGHENSMELFRKEGYVVHRDITYLTKREDRDV